MERTRDTLNNIFVIAKIVVALMIAVAIGVGTFLGYRWWTDTHTVSTDDDGVARAKVIRATLFARNELRVGQLSGTIQGVGKASRLWGWLQTSLVVKAPFKVDYFMSLKDLGSDDFRYDSDRQVLFVRAPEPVTEDANIDLANTTIYDARGMVITRGAMAEMGKKAAVSAKVEAAARAGQPENRAKVREFGRQALRRLLEGALRVTGEPVRVEVRFPGDPMPNDGKRWDTTRRIEDVLRDNP